MYACVYMYIPGASGVILILYDWLNNPVSFQFHFMALAVDVIDRCGTSNKMRCQLQLKKTKIRLY